MSDEKKQVEIKNRVVGKLSAYPDKERIAITEYWTSGEGLVLIQDWLANGLYDQQIANNIGITRWTLAEWKKNNPELNELFKRERKISNLELINATFKSAKGYYVEEEVLDVKGNVHTIKKWVNPNATSQIFLLKNWMKESYRDKHEMTVDGTIPIVFKGEDDLKD